MSVIEFFLIMALGVVLFIAPIILIAILLFPPFPSLEELEKEEDLYNKDYGPFVRKRDHSSIREARDYRLPVAKVNHRKIGRRKC